VCEQVIRIPVIGIWRVSWKSGLRSGDLNVWECELDADFTVSFSAPTHICVLLGQFHFNTALSSYLGEGFVSPFVTTSYAES
jgi:hypothetical protein